MPDLKIEQIDIVTDRINLFTLVPEKGTLVEGYAAGAHIDFDLGKLGTRSYSLVDFEAVNGAPAAYRIAVQREDDGEGGSKAMHKLAVGDIVFASLPKNDFSLHEGDAPALLIAGGIGVTPIISFAAQLAARGAPFAFHYATRNAAQCAFKGRLEALFANNLTLWFDDQQMIDLEALIGSAKPETHIYCCGPKGMIEAVRKHAETAGFAIEQIHFELFSTPTAQSDDKPFEVEISDGRVFTIPPGSTIIEVLEQNGVDIVYDCTRGDCGICQTEVISGEPDHRDVVLSDSERAAGKVMQICVSRARSARLVLDI